MADKQYIYDDFGRVFQQVTKHNCQTIATDTFTYETAGNATSGRVASLQTAAGTYTYTYDTKGNIASVTFGGNTTTYAYDSQNQLIRENNQAGGYTYQWTYDDAGNILSRTRHAYTTGTPGTATETLTYTYGNATWGDLLTKVNNLSITYDTIGNPINYYNGYSFTWENGRRLSSMAVGMSTWTMGYDNSGMRIRRTDGTTDYRYAYNGGKLTQMTVGNVTLDFAYAANGAPMSVIYDGLVYYYVTNLQGDVTAILNQFGVPVVEYTYDAWGNILSTTGSMASTLGQLNPLRYRGYVYDSETGFYYLQSRYYDPNIGRFINADNNFSNWNLFMYCGNNPINTIDPDGEHFYYLWLDDLAEGIEELVASVSNIVYGQAAFERSFYDPKGAYELWHNRPFQDTKPSAEMQIFTSFVYNYDFVVDISISADIPKTDGYIKIGASTLLSASKDINATYVHTGMGVSTASKMPVAVSYSFGVVTGLKTKDDYAGFSRNTGIAAIYGFDYGEGCGNNVKVYSFAISSSYGAYTGWDYYWCVD